MRKHICLEHLKSPDPSQPRIAKSQMSILSYCGICGELHIMGACGWEIDSTAKELGMRSRFHDVALHGLRNPLPRVDSKS